MNPPCARCSNPRFDYQRVRQFRCKRCKQALPNELRGGVAMKVTRWVASAAAFAGLLALSVDLADPIANAATQTVTITAHGYVPNSSTIAIGDSVSFVNSDTTVHQVDFSAKSGFTCSPNPLVIQPKASGTCTFQTSGTYSYSDPNFKGKAFRGTVVVSKTSSSLSVALANSPRMAVYGRTETLSGTTSNHSSGLTVQILSQSCGQVAATANGTTTTTTGGAFSVRRHPLSNTTYAVKVQGVSSNSVVADVIPLQRLSLTSPHHFSIRVSAARSFASKYVTFQRYSSVLRRWVNVKPITLRRNPSGVLPTIVSSASFMSSIARRQKVRTVLNALEAGTCYMPGKSNVIYD